MEDARTAVFVKGTHTGEVLNHAMKDLVRFPVLPGAYDAHHGIDGTEAPRRCVVLEKERRTPLRATRHSITRVLGSEERCECLSGRPDVEEAAK